MDIPIVESLWRPAEAIKVTRNENNIAVPIILLVISAIVSAISGAISTFSLPKGIISQSFKAIANPGVAAIFTFVAVLIGGLLLGLYLMMVMRALNTRSSYFAGVATMAHTAMPTSLAFLIFSILALGGKIGIVIGTIIALIFLALAAGTLYNATREFFETDMVTALVGVSAFIASLTIIWMLLIFKGISLVKAPATPKLFSI